MCIIMPPGSNYSTTLYTELKDAELSVRDIITMVTFLRVYHIINFLYSQSKFHSQKAHFFTYSSPRKLHGTYDNSKFIIFAQMIEQPFVTLFVLGVTVMILAGLLMHVVERSAQSGLLIWDGPWLVAITQLTVGYGDFVPQTDIGRFLAIGPGILGVLTLSLVVTFSFRQLALTRNEKVMIEMLYNQHHMRTKLNVLAALYIQRRWRLEHARRFRTSDRLQKLCAFTKIHKLFKVKFGKALKVTPELEDQLRIFNANVFRILQEAKKRLCLIRDFAEIADNLSTKQASVMSTILSFKRAYFRILMLPTEIKEKKEVLYRQNRKSSRRRSSITNKKESDLAVRKLITRMESKTIHKEIRTEEDNETRHQSQRVTEPMTTPPLEYSFNNE